MRTSVVTLSIALSILPRLAAGQTSVPPLKLTVDDAVRMALRDNVDLATDRVDPQISDTKVAASAGMFRPTLGASAARNNQLQPPTSFLIPTATRNDVATSSVGVNQRLPWFGSSMGIAWNTTHTDSNSILNSYNPLLQSGLSFSFSQPLLRDFSTDSARSGLETSRINRAIADTRLQESVVHTTAAVKTAYWNLVAARAYVDSRKAALELAEELVRVNKAKVDVGLSPPIDLVSAQAEVASNQEQLIVAEAAVKQSEDRLRVLVFDGSKRDVWDVQLEPIDPPPVATAAIDIDGAVTAALRDRADLARSRKDVESANTSLRLTGNQKLPDVRLNASYLASGLGGTQILRSGGFPGTIVGPGGVTNFGSVLDQLFRSNYPTWNVGISVSYPIGESTEEANMARSRLEAQQAEGRVKSTQSRIIQQVRDAGWQVEMNARRIETAHLARDLAEQRRDAEQKRFEVGMSTSFLVIQAQRDLAQATQNELASVLAYDQSLVNFEALQQAGPAGQASGGSPQTGTSAVTAAATNNAVGAATTAATIATASVF